MGNQIDALDFKFLLIEYYKKLRISENELAVILMIDHLLSQKNNFITADLLSLKMNLEIAEIDKILVSLIDKGYLFYNVAKNMKASIKGLKKTLLRCFNDQIKSEDAIIENKNKSDYVEEIVDDFEVLLNKKLSPVEVEKIGDWVDLKYTKESILNALKDSIKKGSKSLKSVEKILLSYSVRTDMEENGKTSISDDWDKNLEATLAIAKTKWLDD